MALGELAGVRPRACHVQVLFDSTAQLVPGFPGSSETRRAHVGPLFRTHFSGSLTSFLCFIQVGIIAAVRKPRLERCPRGALKATAASSTAARIAQRLPPLSMASATYGAAAPMEATALLPQRRPRKLRRSVIVCTSIALCGAAAKVRRGSVQEYRLGSAVGELGEYPTATWEAINNQDVEHVYDLEEHVLVTTEVNDAYMFYKELLFGRLGRATGTLSPDVGIRVKSHSYATSAWSAFQEKLDDRLVKANSIVWVSVANTMDALVAGGQKAMLTAMGVSDDMLYWGCNDEGNTCDGSTGLELVQECVYTYGDGILVHNTMLRNLLSYSLPLTIVLASDLDCKTRLPVTHHKIIYAGDSCQELVDEYNSRGGDGAWFPSGYEGVTTDDEVDAFIQDVENSLAAKKDTLLSYSGSVIFRKPSRVRLGAWALDDGIEAMEILATKASLKLDVESYGMYGMDKTHPEPAEVTWAAGTTDPDSSTLQGRSYYVLAPAGDVWTSGRMLEALTMGAIPVIDETYKTDGGVSSKGCVDPASHWRAVAPDVFVFVDDWYALPDTLVANDALNAEKRDARVARLHGLFRKVADDARVAIMRPPRNAKSVCTTTNLYEDELESLVQEAAEYYTQEAPAGAAAGGMPWFDAFVENPALPTNVCGPKEIGTSAGALCFDAACALPTAAAFTCEAVRAPV